MLMLNPENGVINRRTDDRLPDYATGTIQFVGNTQKVTILNLSGGGAMIDATDPVPEDAELVFECDAVGAMSARVAWVMGKRCGLMFQSAIGVTADCDSQTAS